MTNQGLSVIFITHKMREVLSFSDRLIVLRHGENVGSMKTADASEKKIASLMFVEYLFRGLLLPQFSAF